MELSDPTPTPTPTPPRLTPVSDMDIQVATPNVMATAALSMPLGRSGLPPGASPINVPLSSHVATRPLVAANLDVSPIESLALTTEPETEGPSIGSPRGRPPVFQPRQLQQVPPGQELESLVITTMPETTLLQEGRPESGTTPSTMTHPLATPPPRPPPPPPAAEVLENPVADGHPQRQEFFDYSMRGGGQMAEDFFSIRPPLPAAYMFKMLGDELAGVIMGKSPMPSMKRNRTYRMDGQDVQIIPKTSASQMAFLDCLQNTGITYSTSKKGMTLFYLEELDPRDMMNVRVAFYLFNYTRRSLHGIFRSVEPASWKLKPNGTLLALNGLRRKCVSWYQGGVQDPIQKQHFLPRYAWREWIHTPVLLKRNTDPSWKERITISGSLLVLTQLHCPRTVDPSPVVLS